MVTIHRPSESKEIHIVSVSKWKQRISDETISKRKYFAIIEGEDINPEYDYHVYLHYKQMRESQALNVYYSITEIKVGLGYMIIFSDSYNIPNYPINLVVVRNGKFNDYDVESK